MSPKAKAPILLERLAFDYAPKSTPALINDTKRTLIIKDFSGLEGMQITGGGDVFVENVVGRNWLVSNGSRLWGRQVNLEGGRMKLTNDGGQVWILGLKTECSGPMIDTKGGGKTEVLGALFYSCSKNAADARSVRGGERRVHARGRGRKRVDAQLGRQRSFDRNARGAKPKRWSKTSCPGAVRPVCLA